MPARENKPTHVSRGNVFDDLGFGAEEADIRVSELINGKISGMTADLLGKYLYRLGREIEIKTKTSRKRSAVIV
ncbi:MAG TPA: hypothetical protein VJ828_03905 [Lacipirellulaceae bacterium]|nr:hypothetical protein [Lacipirellulaceae bacterium]